MSEILFICDALGRKEMGHRLGVSKAAIANAVADGRFPSRWYKVISNMSADAKIDCPMKLFNFAEESVASSDAQEDAA
ncbi:hypothetical protein [Sulfitobacter sp. 20_GPM-1509m]|uniref:hypothetical protein n=1 Tax=Sulfitobacter sp. 20_GPM-1509m TaxID=1380367 RepID=UPI00048F3E7D|nr:hypothetical protein [Sulfitobacter sp. 20_GPM-1509m]